MDRVRRNRLGLSTLGTGSAVGVGVVIGLGVLFYVREARTAKTPLAAADAGPAVTAATTPRDGGGFRYYGGFDAGFGTSPVLAAADAGGASVKIVAPAGARIFADGQELPAGTTTVARPEKGIVSILVKAEGKQDTALAVEPKSPPEIHVVMAAASPTNPSSSSPAANTGATTGVGPGPRGKQPARPTSTASGDNNAVPPNPYQ
jgi:hypothetical protein